MAQPSKPLQLPQSVPQLPNPATVFLHQPLYDWISLLKLERAAQERYIARIEEFSGTVDAHCIHCKTQSIFRAAPRAPQVASAGAPVRPKLSPLEPTDSRTFQVTLYCSRNPFHRLHFLFLHHHVGLCKIGQSPSLADIHKGEIDKYRKILGDARYKELAKAVGLVTHGVGIGSFVYLRRIFEWLIGEAHKAASKEPGFDSTRYARARMEEKIDLLKAHLPAFLVENRGLYGILSKGIHELKEDECLARFAIVRTGIELILDEKVAEAERRAKVAAASRDIAATKSELG